MAIAIGLLKTLLELAETKKSGAIEVMGPGARVRIFIEDGEIVFAADGGVGETLGRLLLREKVLTEEQYASAIEWALQRHDSGKEEKLGKVLVELKMLTAGQLVAALSAQVQRKVIRALGWASARVSFVEAYGLVDVDVRHVTPVEPLVLAALRVAPLVGVEELFAQARGRFPALRTDGVAGATTLARLTSFRMAPADDAFARGIDGTRSVEEIIEDGLDRTRPDRAAVLASLLVTDCLDLHARPRGARAEWPPAPRSRPSLTNLGPISTDGRRKNGPPSSRRASVHPPSAEEKAQAQKLTSRLKEAQEARRAAPPSTRDLAAEAAAATPAASRLLAERAFQLGLRLVRGNQLAEATKELRQAATLFPAPEYELWAAWADIRRDPETAEHAPLRAAAERALAHDPELGFAYFALGHLALAEGHDAEAQALFARAKKLDPKAVEGVRDVRLRPPRTDTTTRGEVRSLAPLLTSDPHLDAALPASSDWDVAPQHEAPPESSPVVADATEPMTALAETLESKGAPRPSSRPPPAEPESPRVAEIAKIELAKRAPGEITEISAVEAKKSEPPAAAPEAPAKAASEPPAPTTKASDAPAPAKTSDPPAPAPKRDEAKAIPPKPVVPRPAPTSSPRLEPLVIVDERDVEPAPARRQAEPPKTVVEESAGDTAPESVPPASAPPSRPEPRPLSRMSVGPRPPATKEAAPRRPSAGTIVLVLISAAMIAFAVIRRDPEPRPRVREPIAAENLTPPLEDTPPPPASASSTVELTTASAPTISAPVDAASVDAQRDAEVERDGAVAKAEDAGAPTVSISVAADRGALEFPAGASGHRVYVDGRMVGQPPSPIVIPCGVHAVKVGSAGRTQNMLVPCGERVWVPYP